MSYSHRNIGMGTKPTNSTITKTNLDNSNMSAETKSIPSSINTYHEPKVCKDPRFRAGRKLVQRGLVHQGALKIFALMMDRAEEEFSAQSLDYAAARYEYGYALFLEKTGDVDVRENGEGQIGSNESQVSNFLSEGEDYIESALEHMVMACGILYEYADTDRKQPAGDTTVSSSIDSSENLSSMQYLAWVSEQLSRYLIGIGYVLSYQGKHPDALSSYFNALPFRTQMLEKHQGKTKNESGEIVLDLFKAHRLLVEVYVLIVEEIIKCPSDSDIKTESNELLIKKGERVQTAKIYYENAREELQEA